MKRRYFACDGGPHLLLPASARSYWRGLDANYDPSDLENDYVRACGVSGLLGLIPVFDTQALVLVNAPISAWEPDLAYGSGRLWIFEYWTDDLDQLADAASDEANSRMRHSGLRWKIGPGGLTLMFAGDRPGESVYGEIPIDIEPSAYEIMVGHYDGPLGILDLISFENEHDR